MTVQTLTIGGNTKRSKLGQHKVEIDFDALPQASKSFVIAYGLKQYIADGMAGANDETDAASGVSERVRKLKEADFARTRGESTNVDSVEQRAIKLAKAAIRTALKAKNAKADKEQIDTAAKAYVERDPQWKLKAKEQLDFEATLAEQVTNEEEDSILADLLRPEQEESEQDQETDESGEPAE